MCYLLFSLSKIAFWVTISLNNTLTQRFLLIWNICYDKKSLFVPTGCLKNINYNKNRLFFQLVAIDICQKQSQRCSLKSTWIRNHWNFVPLELHWKNHCRSVIRKQALLWYKDEYHYFGDIFVKNVSNTFHGTGLFLYSLKDIRGLEISWWFQGVQKETIALKW